MACILGCFVAAQIGGYCAGAIYVATAAKRTVAELEQREEAATRERHQLGCGTHREVLLTHRWTREVPHRVSKPFIACGSMQCLLMCCKWQCSFATPSSMTSIVVI